MVTEQSNPPRGFRQLPRRGRSGSIGFHRAANCRLHPAGDRYGRRWVRHHRFGEHRLHPPDHQKHVLTRLDGDAGRHRRVHMGTKVRRLGDLLQSSLRSGSEWSAPVQLPSVTGSEPELPPRLAANLAPTGGLSYANYYVSPPSPDNLRRWIEDAFNGRITRRHLINPGGPLRQRNSTCNR